MADRVGFGLIGFITGVIGAIVVVNWTLPPPALQMIAGFSLPLFGAYVGIMIEERTRY